MRSQGISPDRIIITHNGIDLTPYSNYSPALAFSTQNKSLKIASVGNLHKRKGHEFLIRSIANVLYTDKNIELHIAGEGPERPKLEAIIKDLNLEQNVHLRGYVKNVPEFLLDSDIYIHSSESEPFGIAILEAMAAGLCVIATNVGGVPDIITHNKNGMLFEYGNEYELKDLISLVITDNALRINLAKNAKETVTDKFSILQTVQMYQTVYPDLVK